MSLLLISKIVLLLFGPDTLLKENTFSKAEILIFVVNFFYAILWLMVVLFLFESKEVKQELLLDYLKKTGYAIILLFFMDFLIEGIVYLTTITDYMTFSVSSIILEPAEPIKNAYLFIGGILVLTLILVILFISFLVKRNIRILRYLELLTLSIVLVNSYLVVFYTKAVVGWNESFVFLLKLFSYKYGFTGFIFLIVLAVILVTNSSIILLFNLKNYFINEQNIRHKIINLTKVGFVATCILSCMVIWPYVYLQFI